MTDGTRARSSTISRRSGSSRSFVPGKRSTSNDSPRSSWRAGSGSSRSRSTTPGAFNAIAALQPFRDASMRVGAGTVLTAEDARSAIDAGVDFMVSPTVEPEVVAIAHDAGCAALIGGLTPTEILAAWRAGADVVKVFPGRVATPGYFADLAGPLPDIPLMPTGNVDLETAPAYLRAGAIALGVGKALVNPEHLAAGRFDAVRSEVARWRQLVDDLAVATP